MSATQCSLPGATGYGTTACQCVGFPCADVTSMGSEVTVTTDIGDIKGVTTSAGVNLFFGVSIAAPPTGALRFTAPQPPTYPAGGIVAKVEKPCSQSAYPVSGAEDCLSVDIMYPSGMTGLPIAMWIHGGGFTSENPYFTDLPTAIPYARDIDSTLPANGKAIETLIHYRLGPLGWMSSPAFVDTSGATTTMGRGMPGSNTAGAGNYGMMDTAFAIKYMYDNALQFGGDSSKISVFGESAGAAHTTMLMASPMTTAYVKTFIAQSPFISYDGATFSMTARQEMGMLFAIRAGCATTADLPTTTADLTAMKTCLQGADIALLIQDEAFGNPNGASAVTAFNTKYGAQAAYVATYNTVQCWPVVDGYMLTVEPLVAYATLNGGSTMVVGHNVDEYTTFCYFPPFGYPIASYVCPATPDIANEAWYLAIYGMSSAATMAQIYSAVMTTYGETTIAGTKMHALANGLYYSELKGYPIDQKIGIHMGTDAWFSAGNSRILTALNSNPARTAPLYHFLFGDDTDPGDGGMGACHGCELTYVLGFYLMGATFISSMAPPSLGLAPTLTAAQMTLGKTMNMYWSSLFHAADTVTYSMAVPTWVPWTATSKNTMVFQSGLSATGAVLNPCVSFTKCLQEPTKDYRSHAKTFWGTGPTGQAATPESCTAPIGTWSIGPYGPTTMAATCPVYKCSAWCNPWTHTMDACSSCPVNSVFKSSAYCSPWCNMYTCGFSMCVGCDLCDTVRLGQSCAGWCNSYTSWSKYCTGCSAGR